MNISSCHAQRYLPTTAATPVLCSLLLTTLISACSTDTRVQSAEDSLTLNLVGRAVLSAQSPEGAAEIVQYHQASNSVYALNSSGDNPSVEQIALANMDAETLIKNSEGVIENSNLAITTSLDLATDSEGDANSIAISEALNLLAVAMAAPEVGTRGHIAFYDISATTPVFIKKVEVGYLPDMVTFSPDNSKVIVANEGEPNGDYSVDPEGSISIINIVSGTISPTAIELNFQAYNDQQATLSAKGMMFANPSGRTINGNVITTTVAMDLEPEYVTVTADSSRAYVSLQENNGIAIVDLSSDSLVDIIGLGFKDWGNYSIDASDKDDGINFQQYQHLYGMYQPDTIATYQVEGEDYIVTANEGDGREYFFDSADETSCLAAGGLDYDKDDGCLSYSDESRAAKLTLDSTQFTGINNDDDDLGRLKVSIEKGDVDQDGDYDQLYTYGARSFSIWDSSGKIIFDSGDDFGLHTAQVHGDAFNNDEDENKGDTRSDAKGAEPEALALGTIDDKTYAFIGLERMSGIMVYDISDPENSQFVRYVYNRGTQEGEAISGDLAPEGMKFIAATDETPARLLIGNEISGSVAVWEITAQ